MPMYFELTPMRQRYIKTVIDLNASAKDFNLIEKDLTKAVNDLTGLGYDLIFSETNYPRYEINFHLTGTDLPV